jgi:hypothetical protein
MVSMTRNRHIRLNAELDDETTVVLRGGSLDTALLRKDAERKFEIYGVYGLSVFAALGASVDELAQEVPLIRFALLTLLKVGDLKTAGLHLEATGRNPRHYDISFAELHSGIDRIVNCIHRTTDNPYYEEKMIDIDLPSDLNAQDDDGLGWALLREAPEPNDVRLGAYLVAGNIQAAAVVRIVAVDGDGQVHFAILPGSVSKNAHLIRRTAA